MKTLILAATAVLGLTAGAAHAGEGARMPPQWNVVGNPFPYAASQSRTTTAAVALDTGSQAYSAADGAGTAVVTSQEIPPNSNEGVMQTANSLPPGFASGEVTYFAGAPPAAQAQQTAARAGTGHF